jgi:membrane protein YqaA with SNARE-associated domain
MADLATLFAATFLAATLVPFPSEAALIAYLALHPQEALLGVTTATLGNTAGGMTTYLIGRLLPPKGLDPRAMSLLRRWGSPATALGFLPIIGEAILVGAGWLRVHWLAALAFTATGRLARYLAVAWGTLLATQ